MLAEERLRLTAEAVEDWANAVRMSWFDFDGRQAKSQLLCIVSFARGESDTYPLVGIVCRKGDHPHWVDDNFDSMFHEDECE